MGFWDSFFAKRPPEAAKRMKPEDPCWCGSEKEYKHCHYQSDKRYFAYQERRSCGSI